MLYDKELNREFWARVRDNEAYGEAIDIIKRHYAEGMKNPYPALKFSSRFRYYRDGNRSEFEKPFFDRRILLSSAAILSLIYPEAEEYLRTVEDSIWAICDEYCWALPAHTGGELSEDAGAIDLFTAETAAMLAEITAILKDRLNIAIVRRVNSELKCRVFDLFCGRTYGWENGNNNWSAVCSGGIGIALMYSAPELADKLLPRLINGVKSCLKSYTRDGTCLEGFSYWVYGYGYFVYFADLLFRFTNGKTDMFDDIHTQLVASYPQRCLLKGNSVVSFSDCSEKSKAAAELIYYLNARYPDTVALLPEERIGFPELNSRWCSYLRYFAWIRPEAECKEEVFGTYMLPYAGQYVTTRKSYSFAVKAGDNDEPHNHNDIGEFIISSERGQEICDLGNGLYTKDYFNEHRYEIFCNSSLSHSVPIINGKGQSAGKRYRGTIEQRGNSVLLDISGAYDADGIKFLRRFDLFDGSITLKDRFSGNIKSVTERFVSIIKPTVENGRITFGKCRLYYEPETVRPVISEHKHLIHAPKTAGEYEIAYCVDFDIDISRGSAEFIFETE